MVIHNKFVQQLLYWLFNIISPSINAQVIVTYLLAQQSKFCKLMIDPFGTGNPEMSFFKAIGNDTIGYNGLILVLHIFLLLLILTIIDSGLLQFSLSCLYKSNFDEHKLDDDVFRERQRILEVEKNNLEDNEHIDYLTVSNLVKYYPMSRVLAVGHLTFGARRGEAFGLLGYNVSIKPITKMSLLTYY